jgi:hypothetical protein
MEGLETVRDNFNIDLSGDMLRFETNRAPFKRCVTSATRSTGQDKFFERVTRRGVK